MCSGECFLFYRNRQRNSDGEVKEAKVKRRKNYLPSEENSTLALA